MNPDTQPSAARLVPLMVADWLVEPKACHMTRDDTMVRLRPQLVDVLLCLARRPGQTVLKDEILAEVWPGQYIAESGLSRCIAELRQLLQDDAQQPRFIETIPKRGYRLIAPVVWLPETSPAESGPGLTAANEAAGGRIPGVEGVLEAADANLQAPAAGPHPLGRRRLWTSVGLATLVFGIVAIAFWTTRSNVNVLTERDTVLLADVRNATGDKAFDDALRLALAVNLEQAPFLRILPQEAVRAALLRAGRPSDERVVGPVALEMCRREGAAVLLAGSIASLGSRYVIGLEAIACGTGESIGRAMTEARGKEGVLTALEQAASRIRQRLGESRDSLRQFDVPLVRATTPSFDALVALTRGDVSRDKGRYGEALTHYRQATDLDPQFALAWARRGLMARNVDLRKEAIPALRQAFELRGRVSQPERFFIEGLYYRFVAADPDKAIETFQAWKRTYPGSAVPPNYIAATLSDELGQYEAAVVEAREAVRLAPNTSWPYNNLVQACMGAGLLSEAKKVVAEATSRGLDDMSMHAYMLLAGESEGDQAAIERETRWGLGNPETAPLWRRLRATAAVEKGRLGEARQWWQEALDTAAASGTARDIASVHLDRAEAEAIVGNPDAARRAAAAAISTEGGPLFLVRSAMVLGLLGDTARARAQLDDVARQAPADPAPLKVWLPVGEALIAIRQGRADEALRILQSIARFEKGNDFAMIPLSARGLAALSAGRPAEAVAAFDQTLQLRSLSWGPWQVFARVGLARAYRETGDTARSLAAYDALLGAWKDADPDVPLVKVVERERKAVAGR